MSKPTTKQINFAFIDANNLHLGSRKEGIKIDYRRFRLYLTNRFHVQKAFMFIGYDKQREGMYRYLRQCGFELVFKPTTPIIINGHKTLKGNVDAELVLHSAAIEYANYNQGVIVTSDGDFACLIKFLLEKEKLRRLITTTRVYSHLLRPFTSHLTMLHSIKQHIAEK